jgi:predicted dehydrogenase
VSNEGSAYKVSAQLPLVRRRLRLGIIGGGGGGFIGPVHMLAARMDNRYELLAAAPSSRAEMAAQAGREWFLAPDRVYLSHREMAAGEAERSDGVEVVAITTPNHLHYDAVCAFLDAGIHVICDKPLTTKLEEALDLVKRVRQTGLSLFVTHAFAAYPMVRQARAMVSAGKLGSIRLVHVEFMQDWLTQPIEATGDKHAGWRTDPVKSGSGAQSPILALMLFTLLGSSRAKRSCLCLLCSIQWFLGASSMTMGTCALPSETAPRER